MGRARHEWCACSLSRGDLIDRDTSEDVDFEQANRRTGGQEVTRYILNFIFSVYRNRKRSVALTVFFLVNYSPLAMQFRNVSLETGITHGFTPIPDDCALNSFNADDMKKFSAGVVAEDFNGDGWFDLYVLRSGILPNLMYINNGGVGFSDEATSRGADLVGFAMGAAAADYDNDGDVDICVTYCSPPHILLINDGSGNFSADSTMLTLPLTSVTSPAWGDVDNDGLLELVVGQWSNMDENVYLYRNIGNGVLETYEFRSAPHQDIFSFSPRFADFNNDRLSDLMLVCDYRNTQLYMNIGDRLFQNVTGTRINITDKHGMGHAVGDFNNDGSLDIFVTSIENFPTGNALYKNNGDGTFDDIATSAGVTNGYWGWGASFGDLDNDGDLDIYHVTGFPFQWESQKPARLFENLGNETFVDVAAASGAADVGQGRGVVLFDYDNDGRLDIFIANHEETLYDGFQPIGKSPGIPVLFRNETTPDNHWLKASLEGTTPFHSHGIGSRVYIRTGTDMQMRELDASSNFLSQNPGRMAHFGLGTREMVDEVRAEWVNGDATLFEDVEADQSVVLQSPMAGISSRRVDIGEPVTATAAGNFPGTGALKWMIEGQEHEDPVTHAFNEPGEKEMRLNRLEKDGVTLLFSEVYRIRVVAPDNKVPESLWLGLD
jgi:hypothetical protein